MTEALAVASDEGWNVRDTLVSPRRVGRVLARLRLRPTPRAGGQGSRQYELSVADAAGLAQAYAVPCPELSPEPAATLTGRSDGGHGVAGHGAVSLPPGWDRR